MKTNKLVPIHFQNPQAPAKPIAVIQAVAEWKEYLKLLVSTGELADATAVNYGKAIDRLMTWTENQKAKDRNIGGDTIRLWIADLREEGKAPGTVAVWLAGVRSFFAWCVRNQKALINPTEGIRGVRRLNQMTSHKREALTDSEVVNVIDAIGTESGKGSRDIALVGLMAYCGLRQIEIHRADLSDLKPVTDGYKLYVRGKGHSEADAFVMIIQPELVEYVRKYLVIRGNEPGPLFISFAPWLKNERLSLRGIRMITTGYYKKAGVIGNKTTHSLRHSAATNALRNGAPLEKVKDMLRHANIQTTMIYIHDIDRETSPAERFVDFRHKQKPESEETK
ncbi:MAG: tyrosine-type recombinase/integrase [Patescibacteria group bacterium]|nr:tyrosine-type recombinase/integrase [Patescibacteria group bacterium]